MLYVDNINTQYFVLWLHYCAHLSNNWAIFFGDSVHVESHTDRQSQASKSCLRDKPNDMHSHEWFGQIFGNWFPQGLGTKVLPVGHSVSNLSFLTVCLKPIYDWQTTKPLIWDSFYQLLLSLNSLSKSKDKQKQLHLHKRTILYQPT